MKLDTTDLCILAELQADGSLSNVELARRVHLSPSPCLARVKALEAAGVIARTRSRIPGCEGCLRTTVGTPAENARMIETVKNFRL